MCSFSASLQPLLRRPDGSPVRSWGGRPSSRRHSCSRESLPLTAAEPRGQARRSWKGPKSAPLRTRSSQKPRLRRPHATQGRCGQSPAGHGPRLGRAASLAPGGSGDRAARDDAGRLRAAAAAESRTTRREPKEPLGKDSARVRLTETSALRPGAPRHALRRGEGNSDTC